MSLLSSLRRLIIGLSFCFLVTPAAQAAPVSHMAVHHSDEGFEQVKELILLAITDEGMVVSNELHLSDMLDRTGKDLGISERIYDKAESIEFCSAVLSRKMMAADPSNAVFCPFIITLYTLPPQPQRVHIAYRIPHASNPSEASSQALADVEAMLSSIVENALE